MLTSDEVTILRQVTVVLLPGDGDAPAADSIADLDDLIIRAVVALGTEGDAARTAVQLLPGDITWDALREFADARPADFDILSVVATGAYFMAPAALAALGYPTGPRKAPRIDQAADEISSGVLDDVMARQPMFRQVPA